MIFRPPCRQNLYILATAILDLWRMVMSRDTGSDTVEKFAPENMGIVVGILLLCALELEICLGGKTPHLPSNIAKKSCRDNG